MRSSAKSASFSPTVLTDRSSLLFPCKMFMRFMDSSFPSRRKMNLRAAEIQSADSHFRSGTTPARRSRCQKRIPMSLRRFAATNASPRAPPSSHTSPTSARTDEYVPSTACSGNDNYRDGCLQSDAELSGGFCIGKVQKAFYDRRIRQSKNKIFSIAMIKVLKFSIYENCECLLRRPIRIQAPRLNSGPS